MVKPEGSHPCRVELFSCQELEKHMKGYIRRGAKTDFIAVLFFNRQPRLVISALTELICYVAPVKLKVLSVNSSFEKNQESNYLAWSLITHYWTFSRV